MRRSGPPQRRTPLAPGKPLARGRPLQARRTPARTPPAMPTAGKRAKAASGAHSRSSDPVTASTRRTVRQRSRGWCEVCGNARAQHVHHRKLRRHGDHRPVNLLDVCHDCHNHIHAVPSWAYRHGYMLKSWQDPEAVPVG